MSLRSRSAHLPPVPHPRSLPAFGVQGRTPALKTLFFGVRCLGTALESGDLSPHSKREPTKKECFGDKILNFASSFVLLVLFIDGGQAVFCASGLFGGGNRGFSNPCPPLKRAGRGVRGGVEERGWLRRRASVAVAGVGRGLTGCSFQVLRQKHKKHNQV